MRHITDIKIGFEYNDIDQILWLYLNDDVIFYKSFHIGENKTANLLKVLFKNKCITKKSMVKILGEQTNLPIESKLRKAFSPLPWEKVKLFLSRLDNGDIRFNQYISMDKFLAPDEYVKINFSKKKIFKEQEECELDIILDVHSDGFCSLCKKICILTLENIDENTDGYEYMSEDERRSGHRLYIDYTDVEKSNLKHHQLLSGSPHYKTIITRLAPLDNAPLSDNSENTST